MRDGIYSFDIRSDEWVTNGIVLIENGAIRGFNSNHVYTVERSVNSGKTRWCVAQVRYVSQAQGFSMLGFPATLYGEEGEDRFALKGKSDADINVTVEIQGRRLCDLPWARVVHGGLAIIEDAISSSLVSAPLTWLPAMHGRLAGHSPSRNQSYVTAMVTRS
jgi:hypothetical protein